MIISMMLLHTHPEPGNSHLCDISLGLEIFLSLVFSVVYFLG